MELALVPDFATDDALSDRKQLIVAAAYDLLDAGGLEGLTIRAVLAKTGLARRAFYDCYVGKDDLVLAVFEQTIRMAVTFFAAQVRAFPDPLSRIRHIVVSIVLGQDMPGVGNGSPQSRRGAALSREHLRLGDARPHELQIATAPLIDLIATQLAEGMEAGSVREMSPLRLAVLVYNLVSTTVHAELLAEEGINPDPERRIQLAEDIWEFCRRAIIP